MPEFGPSTASWCLAGIQVMGLTSGWLARIGENSPLQNSSQWLFYLCLALVGMATIGTWMFSPHACLGTSATLCVMVLTATWDFSSGRKVAL